MTSVARDGDAVRVTLSQQDRFVLRSVAEQVVAMLTPTEASGETVDPLEALVGMGGGAAETPEDPALRRLLPDAYGDDESAAEFRRLMDGELRRTKTVALERVLATATDRRIALSVEDAEMWLQALNDVRLVLGVRLDVQEDMEALVASMSPDDERWALLYAYDRLTRLQDALVDALL